MKKKTWLIAATVGGLLATTAAAGASGLTEKVTGLLHRDVAVSVDGESTGLQPVYINGKAYLPARETAEALGYDLAWSKKEIKLSKDEDEEEAEYIQLSGVIVDAVKVEGEERYRLEVLGHGINKWVILFADKDTVVTDAEGNAVGLDNLKAGLQITADYGPIMAMSYPGQSHAAKIQVGSQRLIEEGQLSAVEHSTDGWRMTFSEAKDGEEQPKLVLNAGKETMLITREGQPVDWNQLRPGTKVRAYYGPIMTKSLPPQSPAHVVVVLDEELNIAHEDVEAYRELAWKLLSDEQKEHVTTDSDKAQVTQVDAKSSASAIMAAEGQKQLLEDIVAQEGKLIVVTYSTDEDALLGPLKVVIDPQSKEHIGYFIRK